MDDIAEPVITSALVTCAQVNLGNWNGAYHNLLFVHVLVHCQQNDVKCL